MRSLEISVMVENINFQIFIPKDLVGLFNHHKKHTKELLGKSMLMVASHGLLFLQNSRTFFFLFLSPVSNF